MASHPIGIESMDVLASALHIDLPPPLVSHHAHSLSLIVSESGINTIAATTDSFKEVWRGCLTGIGENMPGVVYYC